MSKEFKFQESASDLKIPKRNTGSLEKIILKSGIAGSLQKARLILFICFILIMIATYFIIANNTTQPRIQKLPAPYKQNI